MGVAEYVRALLASDKLGPQVRHHRCEPARAAVYAESRLPWPAAIRRTLEDAGSDRVCEKIRHPYHIF